MRSQIRVVQWPIKTYCRQVTTSTRCHQASEGPLDNTKLPTCPVHGSRARSTHAALDPSVFETVTPSSIRPWEEVPGPKPLPLLGNTWRFAPFIGK
ncbi:probable cytochrome P450 49a1 [Choristoneura fumiferana]|uniref:probable cytochrome P450 49a1 n=1 Tax=Choristoneura fumiferana TaxID=7141 RepID=UPI003D153678